MYCRKCDKSKNNLKGRRCGLNNRQFNDNQGNFNNNQFNNDPNNFNNDPNNFNSDPNNFNSDPNNERYLRCNHYYNDSTESHTKNNFVRNNHHMNTNHHYVNDKYYVNDFYYTKEIYHYDRDVVQKSYDCGTETVIDPSEIYAKPTPYHTDCIEDHYDECTKNEFFNSFKCENSKPDCNCGCECR